MKKAFLGGTCNESTWRESLIPLLKIDYFNPVVKDWTPDCMQEEIRQRESCDYCIYVVTPRMRGVYSIAEVIDDSNKRPQKTIFAYLKKDRDDLFREIVEFDKGQLRSLEQVGKMVERNGGVFLRGLIEIASTS
jgi:hypothetical protein